MSRSTFLTVVFLVGAILAACGPQPQPTKIPPPYTPTPCDLNFYTLDAPLLSAPADQAVDPANGQEVIIEVYYPISICGPDGFELEVYNNPGFGGNVNKIASPSPINMQTGPNNNYQGSSQLTMPLDDCTQYWWRARAFIGGEVGPDSETRTFFTDFNGECDVALAEVCSANNLLAPLLARPEDNEVAPIFGQEALTEVFYPDADCYPDAFEREVYDNPGFGGNDNKIINPSTVNLTPDTYGNGYYGGGQITTTLDDCTQYWWRGRAIVGNEVGPYSETRTFFTDFNGECDVALVTPCDSGALLTPVLVQPADHAVNPDFGDGGVLTVVRYPDENCYPDAFARFVDEDPSFPGPNNISNPSPVNLPPDANGYYGGGQLTGLLDNCTKYYWRAQALAGNTAGPFSETRAFFTDDDDCPTIFDMFIEIPAEMNFPDWPWGWPMQPANCRAGDTSQHGILATLSPEQVYDLLAVNPEHTYVKVFVTAQDVECWVWLDLIVIGEGIHPPNQVHFLGQLPEEDPPPPPPTATPTPKPTATPAPPECSDGIDNDGDGLIDLADRECRDANDDDELNP